jgi:nucleotide-binding universal stress UspA family protein
VEDDQQPVVVAFDGSPESCAAVTAAARLFADRPLAIVTVWEPGLAFLEASQADPGLNGGVMPPSRQEAAFVDQIQYEHARTVAEDGAGMARELGASARAVPVEDNAGEVAGAVEAAAAEYEAVALVVGSRGLGGVKARILGSTSRRLLRDARRPVVVVRSTE